MRSGFLFWDNDGILVDTELVFYESTARVLASVGVRVSLEDFKERSLKRGENLFDLAVRKGIGAEEVDALRRERNRIHEEALRRKPLLREGAPLAVAELGRRSRMAVVTTSLRQHLEAAHSSTDLLRHFELVLTREDYLRSKPAPDPYREALDRTGADSEHCLVIEDSERGLQSAVAAGLACVVVPTELSEGGDFSAAVSVYGSLPEMAADLPRRLPWLAR